MTRVTGKERETGDQLSLIWCGPEAQQAYMLSRIFGPDNFERQYIGRRPLVLLKRLLASYNCSLGIVAGPASVLNSVRQADDIEVPWWIGSELDISRSLNDRNRPKSLKEDLRRVRKYELEFRCTTDAESYRYFYDNFYLPTVIDAHGDSALPTDFATRSNSILNGEAELVWVTRHGEKISGMVICYEGPAPILRDLGLRDGDRSLRNTGAVAAAYYFAMQRISERGIDRVRLGMTRPFLDDGVLAFKQKWKPEVTGTSHESFLIRVNRLCDASRSFLRTSSFIGEQAGELNFTLIAANDDDYLAGTPVLDKLSSIYGIQARSYIDVSGRRPKMRKAS